MTEIVFNDEQAKRNVAVLIAVQAILGCQLPMIFVIGGLAGGMLTKNLCFATLPISLIVFGSMTTAPWLSALMQKRGRKFGSNGSFDPAQLLPKYSLNRCFRISPAFFFLTNRVV